MRALHSDHRCTGFDWSRSLRPLARLDLRQDQRADPFIAPLIPTSQHLRVEYFDGPPPARAAELEVLDRMLGIDADGEEADGDGGPAVAQDRRWHHALVATSKELREMRPLKFRSTHRVIDIYHIYVLVSC